MAGERIVEAIDLADGERTAFQEYEEAMSRLSEDDAMRLQPPPRNPVLAAYELEPEAYVLRVVERVQSTALQDALLVLPFGKVVSLMGYLNVWAQRVCCSFRLRLMSAHALSGMEYYPRVAYYIFLAQNTSSPDCRQPHYAHGAHPASQTFA